MNMLKNLFVMFLKNVCVLIKPAFILIKNLEKKTKNSCIVKYYYNLKRWVSILI